MASSQERNMKDTRNWCNPHQRIFIKYQRNFKKYNNNKKKTTGIEDLEQAFVKATKMTGSQLKTIQNQNRCIYIFRNYRNLPLNISSFSCFKDFKTVWIHHHQKQYSLCLCLFFKFNNPIKTLIHFK